MAKEIVNLNAGPAGLPRPALERAQAELLDFQGTGISVMEHSHRGAAYDAVHNEAIGLARELLEVPESHAILLLQGGASQLFATIPMNFLEKNASADYVITGNWSQRAQAEARYFGKVRTAGDGQIAGRFVHIPTGSELDFDPHAAYVHITTNNTVEGTQFHQYPATGSVPLVADMSSDIFAHPVDVAKFGLIYAGAQKNLGPSGIVLVIAEKSLIECGSKDIPIIFQFRTHADSNSLYHTPPTFAVYLARNVLSHLKASGGLRTIALQNQQKATTLYRAIDESGGYYQSAVEPTARSTMNVVFRLPTEELEARFVKEAEAAGFIGIKGHRSVGGCRASIYNAVSLKGVERLVEFMGDFKRRSPR